MFDVSRDDNRMPRRWCVRSFLSKFLLTALLTALLAFTLQGVSAQASPIPTAAYSFDEGSGSTVKDSAGNHTGTIQGASWAAVGKYGSALSFDGENDLVSIADVADLDLTDSFTLEAWVYPETATNWTPVISKNENPESGYGSGYVLFSQGPGKPRGWLANSGTTKSVTGLTTLPTKEWRHLAFTSDGPNLRLYVDGKLVGNPAPAIAAGATATELEIGHWDSLDTYFEGLIDEVRVYDELLTEGQIQIDRDTAVGLDPLPIAAYSFDEGSGSTAKDSAGNHNGTISGATWSTVGKYGSALSFDGEGDLVSITDAAELGLTGAFTLEAWVRPDSLTVARPVISKGESSGGGSGYLLSAKHVDNAAGFVASSGNNAEVSSASSLPTATWSHLALTFDGTDLRLYVGGTPVATESAITAKATNASLEIGHSAFGGYFDGLIDEVRLYDEALYKKQIQIDRDTAVGLDQLPIAAYSFDEGSGSTVQDSAGNHTGTIQGASWATGKFGFGFALNFDGINDLVSIPNAVDFNLTNSFTLEAWVRPDTAVNWTPVIAKAENTSSGDSGYVFFSQGPGKPRGWLSNSGATWSVTGPTALPTGTWSHLAFTHDGTYLRLYANGQLVATSSPTTITAKATVADLEIGHSFFGGYFDGLIDEVRIYNEALSQIQIGADRDNRVEPPPLREVTTHALDTGSSSELISSVPITNPPAPIAEKVVYSLALPSIIAGEALRATGNLKLINDHSYDVTDSVRLVLGTSPSDSAGTATFTPWTRVRQTSDMDHWTLPINGVYHARSNLGTLYLNLVVKAESEDAESGEALEVAQDYGRLAVTRYAPAAGPLSQDTHQLQPLVGGGAEQITSLPVDSAWRVVLSRKVSGLSYDDILDLSAQVEVQNTSGTTVQLESQLVRATSSSANGSSVSSPMLERLLPAMQRTRIVQSNAARISDPGKPYLNLRLRAVPVGSSPQPLTVSAGSGALNVLRFKPNAGEPTAPLRQATRENEPQWDATANVSSIPFASGSAPEKRVVASRGISGLRKGDVIYGRGLVTGDLASGNEAKLVAGLIIADNPTGTSGDIVAKLSGDDVTTSGQIHTVFTEGTYVAPRASYDDKYLNLVAYADRAPAYSGESMKVPTASVSYARSMPMSPLDEGFEGGLDEDGINSLFEFEYDGTLSATSAEAREGQKSMLVDLDFSNDYTGDVPGSRRVEGRLPDLHAAGGIAGGETWYGFSVYFPDEFKTPGPNPYRLFAGMIDEVRLYDEPLSQGQISTDLAGEYGGTPTPVAAYGFNEGSGSFAADSTGSHNGAINGAVWDPSGKYGAALRFDGIHDLVTVPDTAALDFTDAFTLEAWVQPESLSSFTPVITKAENPEDNSGYTLDAHSYGGPTGRVFDEGEATLATGPTALPTGTWSHLALTSDGDYLRVYVNGEVVATQATIDAAPTNSDLTIGASSDLIADATGPYTVFTQWRQPNGDGIEGCASSPSMRPPVTFSARYYKANAHTNPGETETATPTAGDYIDVRFFGGELNPDCQQPVNPEQIYVVAPLEQNRWYDFVQHTKWTGLEGNIGHSITEVWIDGDQVLGDKKLPVSMPSLFWHETPENANLITYPQFGLYGGNSFEDPTQRIYIDAVRSGNSYSDVEPSE